MLCHLISEEEGSVAHATVKHAGLTPKRYHSRLFRRLVNNDMVSVIEGLDNIAERILLFQSIYDFW